MWIFWDILRFFFIKVKQLAAMQKKTWTFASGVRNFLVQLIRELIAQGLDKLQNSGLRRLD